MSGRTYVSTSPIADACANLVRNALFSGALIWGFQGSWQRAAAVSATALPVIAGFGYLRSNHLTDKAWYKRGVQYDVQEFQRAIFPTTLGDPAIHLIDSLLFLAIGRQLVPHNLLNKALQLGLGLYTGAWCAARLVGFYPDETVTPGARYSPLSSRDHDSVTLGLRRLSAWCK